MSAWIFTKDRLPHPDMDKPGVLFDVKFKNGKTAVATFDSLDAEKPFCPWERRKSRGKYYYHGYPKSVTVAWRLHDDPSTGG